MLSVTKTKILLSVVGMSVVALLAGCSGSGADNSASTNDSATASGSVGSHAATVHDNGNIAGMLKWSGDSSGRHVYKTAYCGVLAMVSGGVRIIMEAPVAVDKHRGKLAKLDQPWLNVAFMGKGKDEVAVNFYPQPGHQTKENSFTHGGTFGQGVSWSKEDGTYVIHLNDFHVVSPDIKQLPDGSIDEHDYDAYLTGDVTCTKIESPGIGG